MTRRLHRCAVRLKERDLEHLEAASQLSWFTFWFRGALLALQAAALVLAGNIEREER